MTPEERDVIATSSIPALARAPRGVYDLADRPAQRVEPIVFVGGTGRSGTHIVARFIGRHKKFVAIPVECRFHVEDRGFPGLLEGTTSKRQFLSRLRGFWWSGRQRGRRRGMHRLMPRERFDAAVAAFDASFDAEPEAACRALFLDLLWPLAIEQGASGIVEQSTDVVAAAPTLVRLFPEAKFVHVVRDGRDASASRVAQTHGLIYPRTRRQGLEWWERRIRAIDAGAHGVPEGRLLEIRLEGLLDEQRRQAGKRVAKFAGVSMGPRLRNFLRIKMSPEEANQERWRRGLPERRATDLARRYGEILGRLEADGVSCIPLLRGEPAASPAPE
jgi:Sulfotransferase family